MKEIWKDIDGYVGKYQISNLGRVKSLARETRFGVGKLYREEKILCSRKGKHGYLYVNLYKDNGKRETKKIHRLVACAFLENKNNYRSVNHKDEDKANNNVNNLEWCTDKYNNNYGASLLKRSIKKSKVVEQYSLDGKLLKTYKSFREAEKSNMFSVGEISRCCSGKRKTAYGYIWKVKLGEIGDALNEPTKV